jgi:flagellar hook-length control protein FliK
MNLSSYLQMPPAPNVPQSPTTSATHGLAAGIRADAGKSAGQDFANIMARQFQRLSASERPSSAAEAPPKPEINAQANAPQRAPWANGQSFATHQRLKDERQETTSRDANPDHVLARSQNRQARADIADNSDVGQSDAGTSDAEMLTEQRAQQLRDAASAKALNEADATLLAQVAMMAMPFAAPTQASATTPVEAPLNLRAIALSPQMHIITAPSGTPNAESLTAFAQSMGLDEAAIQKLLGEGAANPSTPAGETSPAANAAVVATNGAVAAAKAAVVGMNGVAPATQGLPMSQSASAIATAKETDPLTQALNDAVSGMPAASTSPALPSAASTASAATQLAALGLLPDAAPAAAGIPVASDLPVMTPTTAMPTHTQVPGNAPQAPVQGGLSAAETASMQQIQITVAAPVAASVTSLQNRLTSTSTDASSSTSATVSLLGGDVTEQSINDLVAQFSNNTAGGGDAQQQPSSDNSGGQGFAQALSQTVTPTQASSANSASPVATATPMSEVYDQLSDKMATEMAARMHKQLSDGEWKMKFGLRPAHLGGVEIQLEMKDGKLNAVFQAENPLTRDLLQNSSQRLRDALENFGIQAGQVHIGQDSGNAQQNPSRGSPKSSQVGDNSTLQVKDSDKVASATENRHKANASLLDLYA